MSKKTALIAMFIILGTLVIFHLLILSQIIPHDKVWGGRLESVEEMQAFEIFSIIINLFMLLVFGIKYIQLQRGKRTIVIDILIWVFAAFFALNTMGNLFAESMLELILDGVVTLLSAVLCFIIVRKEKPESELG